MAEEVEQPPPTPPPADEVEKPSPEINAPDDKTTPPLLSFNIWPPSQRTRDAVINRLVETLTTPSILSKRYGTIPPDEAAAAARRIEESAFSAAGAAAAEDGGIRADTIDGGVEILQIYSKEISRTMLESVKARGPAAPAAPLSPDTDDAVETPPVAHATEEAPSEEPAS